MIIGSIRLKELRIRISGHGSRYKELSSCPSEEIEKKWKIIKGGHLREEYCHLKKAMSTRNCIMK